jgi:predicted NBD/HSP70 family sugar kinase
MAQRIARTVRDLRRSNRALLLSRLYFDGPLSRQDLVNGTPLSAASVSNVTAELIADGLVVEAGAAESEGGRPRILLRVDSGRRHAIGVDVGETRVVVELFNLDLAARARAEFPLPSGCGDVAAVVELIGAGLRAVLADGGVETDAILGVGVGVPGVVEHTPDAVVHSQTVGWAGVPLERLLREVTGLPLHVDNGATTLGQAEMWFGAGRGARDAVVALIGSGVGACVVMDGTPYRGTGRGAGEWGHTTIELGGRACRCGSHGCLEAYVGAAAVISRYRELSHGNRLAGLGEEDALAAILAANDDPRDDAAHTVLEETARYLGAGIANLINLFNPERIVIGGWAGLMLGSRLLPRVEEVARGYALKHAFSQTALHLCQLGPDAVARGAATLPVARFLTAGAPTEPCVTRTSQTTDAQTFR